MALLAAILQNRQNVPVEGDILRRRRPGEEHYSSQQRDHCLYYIRVLLR